MLKTVFLFLHCPFAFTSTFFYTHEFRNMKQFLLLLFLACSVKINAQQYEAGPKYSKADLRIKTLINKGDVHFSNCLKAEYPYARDSALFYAKKVELLSIEQKNQFFLAQSYMFQAELIDVYAEIEPSESQYQKSLGYIHKAISIFRALKKEKDLSDAHRVLLQIQEYRLPIEETIVLAEKVRSMYRKTGNRKFEGKALEDLAYYHSLQVNIPKAIEVLNEALGVYEKAKIENVQGVYSFMGALYNEIGEFDKALHYSLKAVKLAEKYQDVDYGTVDLYNFTGVIYRGIKKYDEALKYFEKAVAVAKKLDNEKFLVFYEANAAEVAMLLDDSKKVKYYLNEMEKKAHLVNDPIFINPLTVLTKSYVRQKNDRKADKYAQLILKKMNTYKSTVSEVEATRGFSSALMSYYFYKKKYELCRKYTLIYKDVVFKSRSKQKIMNAYMMLSRIDSAQGNYKSALQNYKLEMLYKDSIFNETKNRQLTELQVKYESDEKEKSNLLLKKQAELQQNKLSQAHLMKNVGFAGIGILILAVALLYRRYLINRKIKKVIDLKNEKLQNIVKEKEWLLKEIHHRVKNNLQVVMSLLNTQSHYLKDESAKKAIMNSQNRIHSMSLIHKKLYQSNKIVSVNMDLYIMELVEYLKGSFDTEQRICFEINADPIELNSAQSVPLSLILNETIMNSIKHAFPDGREGIISISLMTLPENRIRLTVKDNGIGYSGSFDDLKASSSLGIKLIMGFSGELNAVIKFNDCKQNGFEITIEFTGKLI